jgi:tetratricopeptide (TPR) repeat protein
MLRPMDARITRMLKLVAMVMAAGVIGWAAHDWFSDRSAPGDLAYLAGNRAFENGDYGAAAAGYRDALEQAPDHIHALRGLAQSLHMAGLHERALLTYDEAIAHEPEFGGTYANRGMLLDTIGRHEEALADYMRALELDPEVADGPHWLTRFLRDEPEALPNIAARAEYLRAELAKPEEQRLLRMPEIDARQRPYHQ